MQYLTLGAALVLPMAVGFSSRSERAGDVYASLKKPDWSPPPRVFGPVWTFLYVTMGIASWLVWKEADNPWSALAPYAVNLALNYMWSPLFFGAGAIRSAAVVAVCMAVSSVHLIGAFAGFNAAAGWLVLPTAVWTAFAAVLNVEIAAMN